MIYISVYVTRYAAMLYSKGNPYYYKEENLEKKAFRYIGKDCAYMLPFPPIVRRHSFCTSVLTYSWPARFT